MIPFQVDVLKQNVASRIQAFQQDVEKFGARWHQLKPKSDALDGEREKLVQAIEFIKEKRQEFNELIQQKDKIV